MAVGWAFPNNNGVGIAEEWDGSTWQMVKFPAPSRNVQPVAISCTSRLTCIAAGVSGVRNGAGLIAAWDGSKWSVVQSPSSRVFYGTELLAVSCPHGSALCTAVGTAYSGHVGQPFIETGPA